MKNNEVIATALRELECLGIKSKLENTGGGHVRLVWRAAPDKPARSLILPSTPSDNRARWNARCAIRRLLKADNVNLRSKKPDPRSLVTKVHLQQQPAGSSLTERQFEYLCTEVADNTEMLFELCLRMGKEHQATTEPEANPTAQPHAKGPEIGSNHVRAVKIIDFVTRTPLPTDVIARKCGLPKAKTYTKLMYARRLGKVFLNGGMWGLVQE